MRLGNTLPGLSGFAIGLTLGVVAFAASPRQAQRREPNPTPIVGRAVPRNCPTALTPERTQAFVDARAERLDYLPGEVLVKFRSGTSAAGRQRALMTLRSRPSVDQLQWTGDIARLTDPSQPDATVLAEQLAEQPEVEFAQPNYVRRQPAIVSDHMRPLTRAAINGVPNDPDYQGLQWNFSLINMPGAWDINPGGTPSIIVAVIDTGLTTTATTLTRQLWTGQQFETVTLPFAPSPDFSQSRVVGARDYAFEPGGPVLDFYGHGTHVASTIAEDANNTLALAGMAYKVRIMPVKVCVSYWELMLQRAAAGIPGYLPPGAGGCTDEAISAGIHYAVDNGARVINMSLGGSDPSPVERDALMYAVSHGAFVAVSEGNEAENGNAVQYPAAYAPSIAGLMSVGAVGKSKTRAYYSSTGSDLEISAPGGSDRDGGGEDFGFIWQVTLVPSDSDPYRISHPRFDRYDEVGYIGTSMSAAHVSAMAALLMSQGITSPQAVEAAIEGTALDLGAAGRDDEYGYGLIQPRTALFGMGIQK